MAEDQAPANGKKKDKEAKAKKPSALKRDLQNEKKRLSNRSFRASVLTAIRSLDDSISQKEANESIRSKLNLIYSLMDKGVKKGVYKPQKAARTKSRLTSPIARG